MPSADQVPVKSPHSTMRWHKWGVLIAGSTGTALRAVRPTQLNTERDHACARRIGQPLVLWIGGYLKVLLGRLSLHKPHARSGDRFAYRLGVGGIILLSLHIGLHISRWHESHGVADRPELARPMMRC